MNRNHVAILITIFIMQCILLINSFLEDSDRAEATGLSDVAKADLIARIHVNHALIERLEENENGEVIEFMGNEVRLLIMSLDDVNRSSIDEKIINKYVDEK